MAEASETTQEGLEESETTMKKLALLLIALALPVCCQPPPNYCGPDYMLDIWRIQITITNANPQAQIDAVIDNMPAESRQPCASKPSDMAPNSRMVTNFIL